MTNFGWSYPAGVTRLPWDDADETCEICLNQADACLCPECPACGASGDPACYRTQEAENHGLEINPQLLPGIEERRQRAE